MLKALLLSLTLALAGIATAQNLVPNGGFEDTVDCSVPTQCTLLKAVHWRNPTPSTPDVWDCDVVRACGYVMDTLAPGPVGSQSAFPGKRLAGCLLWDGPEAPVRDYAMTRLQSPLVAGRSYAVSVKYSRAEGYMYAVDHIGVWLGSDSLTSSSPYRLEVVPQLRLRTPSTAHLVSEEEWETISDTMIASGSEQWMVIGLFDAGEDVDAVVANPSSIAPSAYYFFDDVSLVELEGTSIAEVHPGLWWDGERINVMGSFAKGPSEFLLWDAAGRLVQRSYGWIGPHETITLSTTLSPGLYVAQLQVQGFISRFKFVKGAGGL